MGKRNREYGLMAGIAVGFAVWGAAGLPVSEMVSVREQTWESVQMLERAQASENARVLGREQTRESVQVSVREQVWENARVSDTEFAGESARVPEREQVWESARVPETEQVWESEQMSGTEQASESVQTLATEQAKGSVRAPEAGTPSLDLHALSAVLIDGDSGRILYEKEGDTFRPMASTTKIMTCILALEHGNLTDLCTVSANAAGQPQVRLGVRVGQQFKLNDLLYSLMLESHNDAAVIIAEHIGGSVKQFAAMMNQKARDIGCQNTCFVTPNGLDASFTEDDGTVRTHGTTAADLARIMRYCIRISPKREEFLMVTGTANYSFTDEAGKCSYSCVNHNALLTMMEGALSGKTGFTGGAGYSYVGAIESEGRSFILALLGCGWPPHKTWKWADARTLFQYGKERFHYRNVDQRPQPPEIPVEEGIPEPGKEKCLVALTTEAADEESRRLPQIKEEESRRLPQTEEEKENSGQYLTREDEKTWRLLLSEEEEVTARIRIPKKLEAPVEAGMLVGAIEYTLNGSTIHMEPLYTKSAVGRKGLHYYGCLTIKTFLLEGESRIYR
ncbi:MAG: D-alanyl-D-alanine carboxypeptidase family protein [Eubacteriales bacterium]|nr:D-alanyl-D-alanine carboxypeptidase family protein [Eubacteriales bacterium]